MLCDCIRLVGAVRRATCEPAPLGDAPVRLSELIGRGRVDLDGAIYDAENGVKTTMRIRAKVHCRPK